MIPISPDPAPPPMIQTRCAWPWTPDLGDGNYRNPIICADYSDPDVVRHGEDYYMTASSFNCTPGLPILHSRDLVNWKLVNHAVKNLPDQRYDEVQSGCGVWAPAIRFCAGKYWIFFPMPDEGIYVTTAADPAGEWSPPRMVQAGKGLIDPCPLWDEDGKAYLVHAYAHSRAGIKDRLRVCPMAPDGSRLLGEGKVVFEKPRKHPTIEGPKFLKRDGWYYILAPAGGVAAGWQVALRSKNIYGPYEDRIVLEQGSTLVNGPHQGGLIDTPGGEWWFIHFQDADAYGRITHLQPVRWERGWPLMGTDFDGNGIGEPVAQHKKPDVAAATRLIVPATTDEFDAPRLGLQWQWNANHRDDWYSLSERPGWLRLFARQMPDDDLGLIPHFLGQKFPAMSFSVETRIDLSTVSNKLEAGLAIMGRKDAAIALVGDSERRSLVFRIDGEVRELKRDCPALVRFRVEVAAGAQCEFVYAFGDAEFTGVSEAFQAVEGRWIGARVGLYCGGQQNSDPPYADFDYLRFGPPAGK